MNAGNCYYLPCFKVKNGEKSSVVVLKKLHPLHLSKGSRSGGAGAIALPKFLEIGKI